MELVFLTNFFILFNNNRICCDNVKYAKLANFFLRAEHIVNFDVVLAWGAIHALIIGTVRGIRCIWMISDCVFYLCHVGDRPRVVPEEEAVAPSRLVLGSGRRVACYPAIAPDSVRVPRSGNYSEPNRARRSARPCKIHHRPYRRRRIFRFRFGTLIRLAANLGQSIGNNENA